MISTTLSSCLRIQATKSNRGRNYESFLRPGGQMQYFIYPLEFKNEEQEVTIDFTFRSGFTADSVVTVNFSVFTEEALPPIHKAALHHADGTSELIHVKMLFSEPSGKIRRYRFTSNLYFDDLLPLFSAPEQVSFELTEDNKTFVVHPTSKTRKKLGQLKEQIILLH